MHVLRILRQHAVKRLALVQRPSAIGQQRLQSAVLLLQALEWKDFIVVCNLVRY
ncbi:hypothetical protein D3C78_1847750 [compost metagenome]